MKRCTPIQLAREECSNLEQGGQCAGIGLRDDGSPYRFRSGRCLLLSRRRCGYLATCVLPAGDWQTDVRHRGRYTDVRLAHGTFAAANPSRARGGPETSEKRSMDASLVAPATRERRNLRNGMHCTPSVNSGSPDALRGRLGRSTAALIACLLLAATIAGVGSWAAL